MLVAFALPSPIWSRSIRFYSDVIGLALLKQSKGSAQLGVSANGRVLLELEEIPGIRQAFHLLRPVGKHCHANCRNSEKMKIASSLVVRCNDHPVLCMAMIE